VIVASRHGEDWMGLFRRYVAAAEEAGDRVRMPIMEGAGHFDGINPEAPAWATVIASVQSLLSPSKEPPGK
jgi:hypothetical protein